MCLAFVVSRSDQLRHSASRSLIRHISKVSSNWIERCAPVAQRGAPRSRSNTNRPEKRLCGTRRAPRVGLEPRRSGVGGLFAVPGLVELLADPEQIGVLDAHTRRALKTQVINALILLHNQDIDAASAETDAHRQRGDRLLMLTRRQRSSASKPTGSTDTTGISDSRCGAATARYSEIGIDDYIRKRRG